MIIIKFYAHEELANLCGLTAKEFTRKKALVPEMEATRNAKKIHPKAVKAFLDYYGIKHDQTGNDTTHPAQNCN